MPGAPGVPGLPEALEAPGPPALPDVPGSRRNSPTGPNVAATLPPEELAGFWLGLWQGFISPITFLVSLFNSEVNIYEVQNDGNWYNFGFMIGVAIAFGGPASAGGYATPGRKG